MIAPPAGICRALAREPLQANGLYKTVGPATPGGALDCCATKTCLLFRVDEDNLLTLTVIKRHWWSS